MTGIVRALLRLRRAMVPVYCELLGGQRSRSATSAQQLLRVRQLSDRVRDLKTSRAAALGSTDDVSVVCVFFDR